MTPSPLSQCPSQVPYSDMRMQGEVLKAAIKEYDAQRWNVIGKKLGKPAKVSLCHPSQSMAVPCISSILSLGFEGG